MWLQHPVMMIKALTLVGEFVGDRLGLSVGLAVGAPATTHMHSKNSHRWQTATSQFRIQTSLPVGAAVVGEELGMAEGMAVGTPAKREVTHTVDTLNRPSSMCEVCDVPDQLLVKFQCKSLACRSSSRRRRTRHGRGHRCG